MIPKLFVGTNQEEIQKYVDEQIKNLEISKFDVTLLNQENSSIKIEQIRELKQKLNLKPFQSKIKASIIYNAENLTVEAQNACLKILEEPPENTVILLCTPNENLLLPTVISRCDVIRLKSTTNHRHSECSEESSQKDPSVATLPQDDKLLISNLIKMDLGEKFALAENLCKKIDKDEKLENTRKRVEEFVKNLTESYMHSSEELNKNNLVVLQKTLKNIKSNLNIRLTLENCFINLC